jgi:RNA polymerase sigma factor (sigma-70 family)
VRDLAENIQIKDPRDINYGHGSAVSLPVLGTADFTKRKLCGYTIQMAVRFEDLIEHNHDEIFAYLWRLLGNDRRRDGGMGVEDVVQEVFLRAYRGFTNLRPNSNHRAWLYKIATNCAYTHLKNMKNRGAVNLALQESVTDCETRNDFSFNIEQREQRVLALLNELPAKQKACITLRYLQDLDYLEIAEIIGCSQETVRANVYQAIRRLRVALKEKK